MTSRGPRRNPTPALPGPDPTLETRPVPRERHFQVKWFGPGADPDLRQHVRSVEELDQQLAESGFQGSIELPRKWADGWTRDFLKQIISDGRTCYSEDGVGFVPDPSWGLYIMVTAYSDDAQQNLEAAVSKLIEAVRRCFVATPNPPFAAYGEEAFKRFKLGVIQDKDALQDASDDRVREEYNAHIKSLDLRLLFEHGQRDRDSLNRPFAPHRLDPCIVLDEQKVEELSKVAFPKNLGGDREALSGVAVKFVDRLWRYPSSAEYETGCMLGGSEEFYTGVDYCPICDLAFIYDRLETHSGIKGMFPLSRYVDDY